MALIKNPDERHDPPKPLLEHLLALRDMFIFGAISWAVAVVICACFSNDIANWLQEPLVKASVEQQGEVARQLAVKGPVDGFSLAMSVSFWSGTALSFPLLVFAILRFVFPALTRREKVGIVTFLSIGTAFFVSGVVLAYQQTLPSMLKFFICVNEWMGLKCEMFFASDYIPVIIKTIFAFGLVFQLPLILTLLGFLGIISSRGLRDKRRIAIVICFILAMVLTPPDPMSQIVMAIPLVLLYEVSIWLVWLKEKGSGGR